MADLLGISVTRYSNLCRGRTYVSAVEAAALSKIFGGMPIQTMFDEDLLIYLSGPSPSKPGRRPDHQIEAEQARYSEGTYRVAVAPRTTLLAVPDEYAERVIAFLRGIEATHAH